MIGVSVVLFRSQPAAVKATLAAVATQTEPPSIVAVHVNNVGEVDLDDLGAIAATALAPMPVVITSSEANLGFTGGHNALAARLFAAGCTAVLVLNPDLMLDRDALAKLRSAADQLPPASLLGPLLLLADPDTLEGSGQIDSVGIRWTVGSRHLDSRQGEAAIDLPTEVTATAGISGACLYIPRAAYDALMTASGELFDSSFIAYREDAELAIRASLIGIGSYLVPAAVGTHVRRLRGTSRGEDPAIDALGVRNRFLIAFKYGRRRPGNPIATAIRDGVVIAAVLVRERSSMPALRDAWQLRSVMRAKGRRVRRFAAARK